MRLFAFWISSFREPVCSFNSVSSGLAGRFILSFREVVGGAGSSPVDAGTSTPSAGASTASSSAMAAFASWDKVREVVGPYRIQLSAQLHSGSTRSRARGGPGQNLTCAGT